MHNSANNRTQWFKVRCLLDYNCKTQLSNPDLTGFYKCLADWVGFFNLFQGRVYVVKPVMFWMMGLYCVPGTPTRQKKQNWSDLFIAELNQWDFSLDDLCCSNTPIPYNKMPTQLYNYYKWFTQTNIKIHNDILTLFTRLKM